MADTLVIQVHQLFHSLHLVVLALMIEPPWANGDIYLGRQPRLAITIALLQGFCVIKRFKISFVHTPLRGVGLAFLVAYPTQSRHRTAKDARFGAVFPNDFPCLLIIVVLLRYDGAHLVGTAIPACTPVGAIEPKLKQRSVVAHKFLNLLMIDIHIALITILRLVAVPRREIQSKLQIVLLACLRQFFDQIPFSILVIGILYGIIGSFSWPEAESVMVFGREDHAFHSCCFQGQHPLFAVQMGGIKGIGWRVAIAPFHVIKRV